MPPFPFNDPPVLPDRLTPCLVPRWPLVPVVDTFLSEDLIGVAYDGQGGAFVLTVEIEAGQLNHRALRLTCITPAGVRRTTIDVHRSNLPAGTRHVYFAAMAALASGRCAVAWGETGTAFRVEAFDDSGTRLFSSPLAPAADVPRLPTLVERGAGLVAAFFHASGNIRSLHVRSISSSGAIGWNGLQWARAGNGFTDFNIPQVATGPSGELLALWQEVGGAPDPRMSTIFAQRIGSGGQLLGTASAASVTLDQWVFPSVRRAVTDGDGGCYFCTSDAAGQLTLVRLIRPQPVAFHIAYWDVPVARLADPSGYSLAEDGGAALVACIGANARLSAHRFDRQQNDPWISMGAHDITGLSLQLMSGAPGHFFSHAAAIVPNRTGGATVVYRDLVTVSSPTDVRSGMFYACIEPNGRVSTRRSTFRNIAFPSQMLCAAADPGAAVAAWRDRFSLMSTTNVFAQKVGCCPDPQGELLTALPRAFRGIPLDAPMLPEHLPLTLPARGGDFGYYGYLPMPQLATIPGITLPGGLVNPDMPRPDWVRISFHDLPRDFSIELFTQRGKSVARARTLDPSPLSGGLVKRLEFQPKHDGIYILGIGYQGVDFTPGERQLVRVTVEFGDDARQKKPGRRRARKRGRR